MSGPLDGPTPTSSGARPAPSGDDRAPEPEHAATPIPGDRPPAGRLARPPSERYAERAGALDPRAAGGAAGAAGERSLGRAIGALAPAIGALVVTVAAFVIVGGVLAEQRGLLLIAGIGGAAIGLLAAGGGVSPDGVTPPALDRGRVVRVAITLAVVAVLGGALGTWAYGRLEGGVLDPLTYAWTVFGPLIPAEALVAALAAAWGAGAGPVRSRP
ncbi:MAG: hypothetical protein L0227_03635 [Chloroflexi bacterium]|nr:hypothetical protein [Chloroflexota bacterium]